MLLHPAHDARGSVEPVGRAACEKNGIDAIVGRVRMQERYLACPRRAPDHPSARAERAAHAADDRTTGRARFVGRMTDGDAEPELLEIGARVHVEPGLPPLAGVVAAGSEVAPETA